MKEFKSHYLDSSMSPIPMPEEWQAKNQNEWKDIITGFEGPKKLDIDYQDEENELQIQKTLEEDMFDEEYTKEEMEAVEAKGEMAYDAHKEECPKIDHEDCF